MDDLMYINMIADLENEEDGEEYVRFRFHERLDPFVELSERQFIKYFRLSKDLMRNLINEISEFLTQPTRSSAIDVQTKVLAAVRFYAIGGYQDSIGNDMYIALSQKSVSRAIIEVTEAINHIMNRWIGFPTGNIGLNKIMRKFNDRYNFPGIIGIIDCTHIAIIAPPSEDPLYPEAIYVNRKGYHSVNVQLVCDADMRILHVNALNTGSTSDKFIWKWCNLKAALKRKFEENNRMDCWLLGDGGYNLEPWLLIPDTQAAPDSPAETFNQRQKVVRCTIERCNGLLKARWRCCLKHRVLHYHPEFASAIVNACCVLHNMCVEAGVEYDGDVEDESDSEEDANDSEEDESEDDELNQRNRHRNPVLVAGEKVRERLIRKHFV